MIDGNDECHLVNVCRKNMALLAEVRRTANDIITTRNDVHNPVDDFPVDWRLEIGNLRFYFNVVADGDWISGTDTTNAEVALDAALHIRTIVQTDDVNATR